MDTFESEVLKIESSSTEEFYDNNIIFLEYDL